FEYGRRTSIWTRWYDRKDSEMLGQTPFGRFSGPFLSQAHFDNGVLDGEWSIFDSQQRRCCQISIHQGKRHGMALFWLPDGTVLQQSMFEQGVPTGDVLQLDTKTGKLSQSKNFLDGRQRITKKTMHRRGNQVKFEGNFLAPTSVQTSADDYWNLQFAKYEPQGEELRHGKWQEWYSNGQPKMSGQYDHNQMVGQFTYWHPNGQKAAEGDYLADKHDGTWVWWHQNGQKSVAGSFQNGLLVDQWRWWAENGKLTKQILHDGTLTFESLANDSPNAEPQSARSQGRVRR
ncbi:MAG: toxin-antitoxin system YwqK family antitoxin, partial [Bythopirellula sp.]